MTLGNLSSGAECFGFIWLLCYRSFSFALFMLRGASFPRSVCYCRSFKEAAIMKQRCINSLASRMQLHASDFETQYYAYFKEEET
mmetsp:Transcript_2316/g.5065  ORF Transcript_2316/g.5065 Transcript_2316/m.5065 type:complete len:85 (+) Transcript_2316:296-550(+)